MSIEQYVIDYLSEHLDEEVYAEKPPGAEGKYVVVSATAAAKTDMIKRNNVALRSYADSLADAIELNTRVKTLMDALVEKDEISKSVIESEYQSNNTGDKQYRYQSIYYIVHYL